MRRLKTPESLDTRRPGKTLVTFVLALPLLLGMVGLVLDSGLLLASQRTTQNAADAGALAAAMDLYRGATSSTATTSANTFVRDPSYNNLSNPAVTVTVNIPPASPSPYSGNDHYAEVIVSQPFVTSFIQVLGANSNQTVSARAVAGFEPISSGQGAIVLRTDTQPGITINGNNTRLIVDGGITVNSLGGGVDQYGNSVTSALGGYAFRTQTSTQSPAPVVAAAIQVAGGIDTVDNFRVYDSLTSPNYDSSNPDRPVFANLQTAAPDPLQSLPTPTTSNGVVNVLQYPKYTSGSGWDLTATTPKDFNIGNGDNVTFPQGIYGNINMTGGTATLVPGIYSSISVGGGTVTLNPGVYVLNAKNLTGAQPQSFSVSNGATVTDNGLGVLIYNTGSDYDPTSGAPDSSDGNTLGTIPNSTQVGKVSINGGTVNLSPITNVSSPFNGILFYQRRWNSLDASIGGNSDTVNLTGTIYDKWGNFTLAGQGQYNAEFVVGTLTISGNAAVTINAAGKNLGRVNQVFLVE